jgi:hypothetical protein
MGLSSGAQVLCSDGGERMLDGCGLSRVAKLAHDPSAAAELVRMGLAHRIKL